MVFDAAAVPVIYGVRSKLDKGDAYIPFRQPGVTTSLVSIPDEATHAKYRKLVSNAYSMSSLKDYEPYVNQIIDRLCDVCDNHSNSGQPMNLTTWDCFDVVSKLTLGSPLGFMDDNGKDALGLMKTIKGFGRYVSLVAHMPWLHTILTNNPIMRKAKPSPFALAVRATVRDRIRGSSSPGSHPDLLSHFVATHGIYPELMDVKQVTISASGNLIAGGFSPGTTFDAMCRFLVLHPEAQDKLFRELQAAHIRNPAPFDDLKNLPYLEGIIREAERLHQSVSFSLQRVAGQKGLVVPNGICLPSGTKISCPIDVINQDLKVFGSDARDYVPERWSKRRDEDEHSFELRRNLMDRTELSFGQGSRACIGKNIFRLEIFKVLAALVVRFKFELVENPSEADVFVRVHRR